MDKFYTWKLFLQPCIPGRDEPHPHFIFYCKLCQTTLDFINELINLNCTFKIPLKICLKDIIMGTYSRTHDEVKLETLSTLIEVFLTHLSFCRRKAFHEDEYDKIHGLANNRGNLISRFNGQVAMFLPNRK